MTENNIKLIKIILFFIYLGLVISTEFIYREHLFTRSLTLIKEWQKVMSNEEYNYYKFLIHVGSAPGFITLLAITHIFVSS